MKTSQYIYIAGGAIIVIDVLIRGEVLAIIGGIITFTGLLVTYIESEEKRKKDKKK